MSFYVILYLSAASTANFIKHFNFNKPSSQLLAISYKTSAIS